MFKNVRNLAKNYILYKIMSLILNIRTQLNVPKDLFIEYMDRFRIISLKSNLGCELEKNLSINPDNNRKHIWILGKLSKLISIQTE